MILTSDTFVRESSSWKYKWDSCSPVLFFSRSLLYSSSLWGKLKGSLLIKASVEVGSVTQLSYLHSSSGLQQTKTPLLKACAFSVLPFWSQTRCCGFGWHLARAESVPSPAQSKGSCRLGPGPHILFELTTQAERPVYNLHSRGKKFTKSVWMAVRCETDVLKWRKLCHFFFPSLMWPRWLQSRDQGDVITQRESRTVVTVVPCLCSLQQLHREHCRSTAPYTHHNALYRCMLVTFFYLTKSWLFSWQSQSSLRARRKHTQLLF